jgi:alpha-L-fucosidase 2
MAAGVPLAARGDASTGWSRAWKINFWARLNDGDRAHRLLEGLLRDSTLPNLWDTHPPFQIDGNFGATAGMIEMLLQSRAMQFHILPALPGAWSRGRVSGIRARGDITMSIAWDGCGPTDIDLVAGRDELITLHSTLFEREFEVRVNGAQAAPVERPNEHGRYTFEIPAGVHYGFLRPKDVSCP